MFSKQTSEDESPEAEPSVPRPGQPTRGPRTARPIMALFDLLGRRWALRALWELRNEALTFRELQVRCGEISSSVLNQRLRELREAGIVEQEPRSGYRLTPEGTALLHALSSLSAWAERWGQRA